MRLAVKSGFVLVGSPASFLTSELLGVSWHLSLSSHTLNNDADPRFECKVGLQSEEAAKRTLEAQ